MSNKKNVTEEGVSSYFDFTKADQNTTNVDLLESEYLEAKMSQREFAFISKNRGFPILTKGNRILVEEISQDTASTYELNVNISNLPSNAYIITRPKVVSMLKYESGYYSLSPREFVSKQIEKLNQRREELVNKYKRKKRNPPDEELFDDDFKNFIQFGLDNLTFLKGDNA